MPFPVTPDTCFKMQLLIAIDCFQHVLWTSLFCHPLPQKGSNLWTRTCFKFSMKLVGFIGIIVKLWAFTIIPLRITLTVDLLLQKLRSIVCLTFMLIFRRNFHTVKIIIFFIALLFILLGPTKSYWKAQQCENFAPGNLWDVWTFIFSFDFAG